MIRETRDNENGRLDKLVINARKHFVCVVHARLIFIVLARVIHFQLALLESFDVKLDQKEQLDQTQSMGHDIGHSHSSIAQLVQHKVLTVMGHNGLERCLDRHVVGVL